MYLEYLRILIHLLILTVGCQCFVPGSLKNLDPAITYQHRGEWPIEWDTGLNGTPLVSINAL